MVTNIETDELKKQAVSETLDKPAIRRKAKRDVSRFYLALKRMFDILGGLVGCIIMVPITIFVYIANLINRENGRIFYSQKRIGKGGKNFKMHKFRSMVVDADETLKDYLEQHPKEKEEYIKYRKLRNDPRITKLGASLRKTSLDEWPQFINILKGDMSLVGPRPYLPDEKEELKENFERILRYKPGLTGPWQTAGRSNLKFKDRVKIERCYVPSFKGDAKIIFDTIKKVLKRDGAC